ncbi:MAG: hypothetical protein MRY83_05040 [Flavobacteriales bacterium]|nr:hypothetical protein [Flavobacteriales bacterium]
MSKQRTPKRKYLKYILVGSIVTICGIWYVIKQFSNEKQLERCWENVQLKLAAHDDLDALLRTELGEFQLLVEQSLVIRSQMLEIVRELKETEDEPISPKNLEILKEGSKFAIELRNELYRFAEMYECAILADERDLKVYKIEPRTRMKAFMISLGAALTLYDNYLFGAMMFEEDKRLRRLIDDPDKGFGVEANQLLEVVWEANSIRKQRRIKKGIQFFEEESEKMGDTSLDNDYEYLYTLIQSSPSYNYLKSLRKRDMVKNKFVLMGTITRDYIAEMRNDGFDGISKFFGNSVGLIETRKGKLYDNKKVAEELRSQLQPLDILLEKTPFRLTDKLIPGHFGHVAIWVGNEAELVNLGLWDHEIIKPYHNQINAQNGHNIVEALRSGVQLSSLEHFLNVDDVAILRPIFSKEMMKDEQTEALLLAFRQLGKEYDFNFDVNTTEKIVCSELAYVSYPSINWPTEKTVGRHTISPDNVARLCWEGIPLELVTFYHDGTLVPQEKQLDLLVRLMDAEGQTK